MTHKGIMGRLKESSSPITAMLDRVEWKCCNCNRALSACDCWEECECGSRKLRGKACGNNVHNHPFAALEPLKDWYFVVSDNFKTYQTVARNKIGIYKAIQSGNIFMLRQHAVQAAKLAKAAGLPVDKWVQAERERTGSAYPIALDNRIAFDPEDTKN